jgi:ADP-ribose pyrophosphatase YjhB (NUDIX family)
MSDYFRLLERVVAIAQTGLTYARDPFDRERYEELMRLAAQLMAAGGSSSEIFARLFAGDTGYRTPKVDVRAVVWQSGKVLLARERSDGRWSLPGGWADLGQSPSGNAIKEVLEETGYRARTVRLLAALDRVRHDHGPSPWHVYKLFFHCDVEGEPASETLETSAIGFFALDALPPISTPRVTEAQIRRLCAMIEQGSGEVWFD